MSGSEVPGEEQRVDLGVVGAMFLKGSPGRGEVTITHSGEPWLLLVAFGLVTLCVTERFWQEEAAF